MNINTLSTPFKPAVMSRVPAAAPAPKFGGDGIDELSDLYDRIGKPQDGETSPPVSATAGLSWSDRRKAKLIAYRLKPVFPWEQRRIAARKIADLPGDALKVPLLEKALKDKDYDVRAAAVASLGQVADLETKARLLREALNDRFSTVLRNVLAQVQDLPEDAQVPLLGFLLDRSDLDRDLCPEAVGIALKITDAAAQVQVLEKALSHESDILRAEVAKRLGAVRDPQVQIRLFEKALGDESESVYVEAAKQLNKLQQPTPAFCLEGLSHASKKVRRAMAQQIKRLPEPDQLALFETLNQSGRMKPKMAQAGYWPAGSVPYRILSESYRSGVSDKINAYIRATRRG